MDQGQLRAIQAPFKERYASEPESALVTLTPPQLPVTTATS